MKKRVSVTFNATLETINDPDKLPIRLNKILDRHLDRGYAYDSITTEHRKFDPSPGNLKSLFEIRVGLAPKTNYNKDLTLQVMMLSIRHASQWYVDTRLKMVEEDKTRCVIV